MLNCCKNKTGKYSSSMCYNFIYIYIYMIVQKNNALRHNKSYVIITSCLFPNDFIRHPWVTSWLYVDVCNRWNIFSWYLFLVHAREWLSKHNSWTTRLCCKDTDKHKTCFWLINSLWRINYGISAVKNFHCVNSAFLKTLIMSLHVFINT